MPPSCHFVILTFHLAPLAVAMVVFVVVAAAGVVVVVVVVANSKELSSEELVTLEAQPKT